VPYQDFTEEEINIMLTALLPHKKGTLLNTNIRLEGVQIKTKEFRGNKQSVNSFNF